MEPRPNLSTRLIGSRAARAFLSIFFWTTIGFIFALPMMLESPWRKSLLSSLAEWWSWGLLTPLIFAFDRRLPIPGRQLGRRVAAHGLGCLVFTTAYIYVFYVMRAAMGVSPWTDLRLSHMFSLAVLGWFLWSCLVYCLIVGALQAYRYYERYLSSELRLERLEKSYSQARLNALRMQLDPHFLFNALNTISSHVERDPKLTRRMIEHLGDLLRMSLESKDRQEVPLAEELAFLDHYLAIQKIRFGDKLKIEMNIAPEVRYASVPSLFIQPLVENAIRHGISRRATGGTVSITATPIGGCVAIRVSDDGLGLPPDWTLEKCPGLGLSVTRERIAGLHPTGDSRFTVRSREGGGTVVEVLLPLTLVEEDAAAPQVESGLAQSNRK